MYDGAFKGEHVKKFVEELKEDAKDPFVVLMDNARIHVSKENLQWYRANDIPIIRNIPYRPDLMGIELLWKDMKEEYRRFALHELAHGRVWDQTKKMKEMLHELDQRRVKGHARLGLAKLMKAEPVDPELMQQQLKDDPEPQPKGAFIDKVYGKHHR